MEELSYENTDLDNLVIKDNEYKSKKRMQLLARISPIVLIAIGLGILLYFLLRFNGGEMTCKYITKKENESVQLLNKNIFEKYTIKMYVDEEGVDSSNTYTFSKSGYHTVKFEFKQEIKSLENFFEDIDKLIEVDLSKLIFEDNKITSVKRLFANCINLKKINLNIDIKSQLNNTAEMLYNCQSIENIDFLKDIDTSNVLNMSNMFSGCTSLNIEKISLKTNKVKDMSKMFYNCKSLTSINTLDITTSEVTDFSGMFELCENLKFVNLSNIKTSKAINFQNFFLGCSSLVSIDLSKFETSNVIDMSGFFSDCEQLESIDLSKFDTSKVTDISGMFSHCEKLISLNLDNFDTKNVIEMEELFLGCNNLETVSFNKFTFDKVEDMSFMFANCEKIKEIKLGIIPSSFQNLKSVQGICYGCKNLVNFEFNIDNDNNQTFNNIIDMSSAFAECGLLNKFIISNINNKNGININSMFLNCESLQTINFSEDNKEKIKISNMAKTFKNCKNLEQINFSKLDVTTSYDFSETFYGCTSLINMDLSQYSFKFSYYMDKMFYGCTNLKSIELPRNMENLIHSKNIFEKCENLQEINLDNFDKSERLMNISGMFKNCSSLKEIKFPDKMKTNYLINMNELFYGCNNLINVSFNEFKTDRIKNMEKMFYDCSHLENLEIRSFKFPKTNDTNISIKDIFIGVPNNVNVEYNEDNLFDELNKEIQNISRADM